MRLAPDRRSQEAQQYRKWYKTTRWREIRYIQLRCHPLCAMCLAKGRRITASVADHIKPHKGDPELFWNPDNLQSLCAPCHDTDKQVIERGGTPTPEIGTDGWPIDQG